MMEEGEYRNTYSEITRIPCGFEKSLTNNKYKCSMADHFWLAGREGYACISKTASDNCIHLLELLREKSRFALKLNKQEKRLPHNKEIRVQAGGLSGIQSVIEPASDNSDGDIYSIIEEAKKKFGKIQNLPYGDIVKFVTQYEIRKRSRKK